MTRLSLLLRADLAAREQRVSGPTVAITEALGALSAQVASTHEEPVELRAVGRHRRVMIRGVGRWNRAG